MSDSQTNFTLTDPAIEPIDLNRMDEFLFSAMLRASIHLGGSHTPLQLSRMVRKSLLKLSLEKDLTFDLGQFTRNYTQTVKRAADNKRRYAPGWVHSTCLLRGFPKGAAPHLAHDFAEQSVVCYTLCRRCPENTVAAGEGKGI